MRRQATDEESGRQAVRDIVGHADEPPEFNNLPGSDSDSAAADFNEAAFLAESAHDIVSPEKSVSSDDFGSESGEADGGGEG